MPRRDRLDETDDDDFDDRPRRSRREGSRYQDERPEGRPGLATTAAVFWFLSAGLLTLSLLIRTLFMVLNIVRERDGKFLCLGIDLVLVLALAGFSVAAGFTTVGGRARSLKSFGVLSLVMALAMVFMETVFGFFVGIMLSSETIPPRNELPFVMAARGFFTSAVLVSGVALAGIFALSANGQYRLWSSQRRRDDR